MTIRCFHRSFSRLLPAAALIALTCLLAGCGRKTGLDLPPGAAAQSTKAPSPQEMSGTGTAAQDDLFQQPASSGGRRGGVVAPRGPKKRIPLDVLLD